MKTDSLSHKIYWETSKWWQTIKLTWINIFIYKLNFLLIVLGPALIVYIIQYNLWSTIYSFYPKDHLILGYSLTGMLSYYLLIFLVKFMTITTSGVDLSEEIRLGKMSAYLVYPFYFWEVHIAKFIGRISIQFFIGVISLLILNTFLPIVTFTNFMRALPILILIALFWFLINFLVGLLALWLDQTWTLRVIVSIIANFLSGGVIPLEFFPKTLRAIIEYTPFPYLYYYPIQILKGIEVDRMVPSLMLFFYGVLIMLIIRYVWNKGMKEYTASGM